MSKEVLSEEERKRRERDRRRRYYLKNKEQIKERERQRYLKNKELYLSLDEPMDYTTSQERELEAKIAKLKSRPIEELIYMRNP